MEKESFPDWLRSELEKKNWSQADFSRSTGISPTQIARIFSGERSIGIESLVSIANALKISPITIIRKVGLLPDGGEVASFEDWKFLIGQLAPEEEEEIRKIVEPHPSQRKLIQNNWNY